MLVKWIALKKMYWCSVALHGLHKAESQMTDRSQYMLTIWDKIKTKDSCIPNVSNSTTEKDK